jgi:hypothetical protein
MKGRFAAALMSSPLKAFQSQENCELESKVSLMMALDQCALRRVSHPI